MALHNLFCLFCCIVLIVGSMLLGVVPHLVFFMVEIVPRPLDLLIRANSYHCFLGGIKSNMLYYRYRFYFVINVCCSSFHCYILSF